MSDQLKNASPRRRERYRFYGVVANAFALTTVTLASLRYTRSNAQDNVSAMSTLSKQWKQLMRCRDLLKQKRCAEFLKWENFKTLSVPELVAAKEISERLLLQEEAITGDFDDTLDPVIEAGRCLPVRESTA